MRNPSLGFAFQKPRKNKKIIPKRPFLRKAKNKKSPGKQNQDPPWAPHGSRLFFLVPSLAAAIAEWARFVAQGDELDVPGRNFGEVFAAFVAVLLVVFGVVFWVFC